jgi:ribosomal protein L32
MGMKHDVSLKRNINAECLETKQYDRGHHITKNFVIYAGHLIFLG